MACDRTFENIIGTYIKLYDSGFEMKKKHERLTYRRLIEKHVIRSMAP